MLPHQSHQSACEWSHHWSFWWTGWETPTPPWFLGCLWWSLQSPHTFDRSCEKRTIACHWYSLFFKHSLLFKSQKYRDTEGFFSPLVKLSVLLHLKRDDLVFQCLGTVAQVIIQIASVQTKHGQGHCDVQWGNLFLHVINALNFLKIERKTEDKASRQPMTVENRECSV